MVGGRLLPTCSPRTPASASSDVRAATGHGDAGSRPFGAWTRRADAPRLAAGRTHQVDWAGPEDLKPGEPQDRFQGATNLKSARWSKPSQPGGTARAERVRKVASPGRRWLRAARRISSEIERVAALRSSGITGSGHQAPMPMEGRIYDNPMRGAQVQRDEPRTAIRSARFEEQGRWAAQTGLRLRRRGEGQEGPAIGRPDPKARTSEKSLADPFRFQQANKGQGGRVEKANDPQPARALATPCCGIRRSGEEVYSPEGPANSREATKAPDLDG